MRDASAPTRVTMVTHYFPRHGGGVERVAGEIATRLSALGVFDITWISGGTDEPPAGNACLRAVPLKVSNLLERFGFPWPIPNFSAFKTLDNAIAATDVVYLHDFIYFCNFVSYALARRHGKPV